ncbi:MAG: hypothetical protein AB1432_05460 [Bacteroidota bacterium]
MINGIRPPKWTYDRGGANEFTINFDYVYDVQLSPETIYLNSESEIDAERDYFLKGSHYEFSFKMNLYKYALTNVTELKNKRDSIIAYKGLKGTLWQHRDGNQFKKSDGSDALFLLKDVIPFYRETVKFRDALNIIFQSCSPVDLHPGTFIPKPITIEIVMSNEYQVGG